MVNENKGKVYKPVPVYNRKLMRSVIRHGVARRFGNHKVSGLMSINFKEMRKARAKQLRKARA